MSKSLRFCACLLFCISGSTCFGQVAEPDLVTAAVKKATDLYTQSMDSDSHLYHGLEYVDYDKSYLDGHQFYRKNTETEATVVYDGAQYTQVPLLYDLVLDQVIIEHPESAYKMSLISEKVKSFSYLGHTFIRLEPDTMADSPIRPGFYDLLVSGNTALLARRTKNIQERAGQGGMEGEFHERNRYFIQKNNRYYSVNDKKSLLKLFSDQKKELQKYARSSKLNFRKKREAALTQLVQFYNSLPTTTTPQS